MPASVAAGDMLLALLAEDSNAASNTWSDSFTELLDSNGASGIISAVAYKIAAGGETAVTATHSSERSNHIGIRIPAAEWANDGTAPVISTLATGNSTAPDPPSTAIPWAATHQTIAIAVLFADDSASPGPITAYPSGYTDNQVENTTTASAGVIACAVKVGALTSPEDPGAFAMTGTETWGAVVIFVKGLALGGGGTTYTQSLGGVIAPAGSLVRQGRRALAGALAPAGSIVRRPAKSLAGAVSPAGAVVKRTSRALAGSISPGGLVSTIRLIVKSFSASLSPAGSISRSSFKVVGGSLSFSGSVVRRVSRAFGGSLSPAGAISRRTGKVVSGVIASAGSLSRRAGKAVAGSLSPAGALARRTSRALAGVIAPAGSLAGDLIAVGVQYFQSFAADLTFSGSLASAFVKGFVYDVLEQFPRMARRWPWQGRGLRPRR